MPTANPATPVAHDRRTISQMLLLAAAGLPEEFTEWDLTVACWRLCPTRFSMRGHPHPDHHRVVVYLSSPPDNNPVARKFLTRVRPSTYRLTPAGRAVAAGMTDPPPAAAADRVRLVCEHPAFADWQADPGRPKSRFQVADLEPDNDRLMVQAAVGWMRRVGCEFLPAGGYNGRPLPLGELALADDFLAAMKARFDPGKGAS